MAEQKLPATKQASLEQEERIAKLFSGLRTPQSGGGNWRKGDVLSGRDGEGWLVECKTSVQPKNSYSVSKEVLDKADHERVQMHKAHFALAFTLGENKDDYFVVDRRTMKSMLDQHQAIKGLVDAIQREVVELDKRFQEMNTGIAKASQQERQLYLAHRAEKTSLLTELEKLL